MENRKVVYFERQQVCEYWIYSDLHGFTEVDKNTGMTWDPDSYAYHTQVCNKESFDNRKYGYVPSRYI